VRWPPIGPLASPYGHLLPHRLRSGLHGLEFVGLCHCMPCCYPLLPTSSPSAAARHLDSVVLQPRRPIRWAGLPSSAMHRSRTAPDQRAGRAPLGRAHLSRRPRPPPVTAYTTGPFAGLVHLHHPARWPALPLPPILIWPD
jgi:hypothetical protein